MKQKTIKINKGTLLVCEFPEYYRVYHRANGTIFCSNVRNKNAKPVWDSLEGNWQLLGRMPEITEEQSSKVVPTMPIQKGKTKRYITAKEAVHSLLQANEVYFENEYGKEKPTQIAYIGNVLEVEAKSALVLHKMKWQEAQSKVWDKERTFLFIKK